MALGVDSASNRNEYQEHFLWGKGRRCVGLTSSWNLVASTSWNPQGPSRPEQVLLYFYLYFLVSRKCMMHGVWIRCRCQQFSSLAVWCWQGFYTKRHDSSNFVTYRANFWTEAARDPLHSASYVKRTGTGSPWPSVPTDGVTRKVHSKKPVRRNNIQSCAVCLYSGYEVGSIGRLEKNA